MSVIDWLLDSDPSIRWQVMRDLTGESDATVAGERSRVASEGWGARLLDLQGPDGHWGGAAFVPRAWISTKDTLQLLRDLGVDPTADRVRRAIGQVRDRCTWGPEFGDSPFFEGEIEPCITDACSRSVRTSVKLAIGSPSDCSRNSWTTAAGTAMPRAVTRRVGRSRRGRPSIRPSVCSRDCWNTRRLRGRGPKSPPHVFADRVPPRAPPVSIAATGQVINPAWTQISFPTRWHYDILWGLDYLRRACVNPTIAPPRPWI